MPMPHPDSPAAQLALRNRQLELVLELDRARDAADDEAALFTAVCAILRKTLAADLIITASFDADSRQLEVRAVLDSASLYEQFDAVTLHAMLAHAEHTTAPSPIEPATSQRPALLAPLRPRHDLLGAIVLINATRTFSADDLALLTVAATQLDSALRQVQVLAELRQERQELRTLYAIDRIRDRGLPFNTMLADVLIELCRAIPTEAGFIMLFDTNGQRLELRAVTDERLLTTGDHTQHIQTTAQLAVERGTPIVRGPLSAEIRSVMCLPLILNEQVIGVLGVINRRDRTEFTRADRRTLWAIASQIDTAIFEGLQIQKYREVFGRRVGPKVMERLLATSERDLLKGERVSISILFSDLRGFTNTAEIVEPELLVKMLNDHLSTMTEIVLKHEGLVDKFVGDCVMALFNVPERQPDHARRVVETALDMMAAHEQLMRKWEPHLPPIGIGIDTGETIVGNLGSAQRNEYTAISHHVNLASRLCGAADASQILISPDTYALVHDHIVAIPVRGLKLKGISDAVDAFQVLGLR